MMMLVLYMNIMPCVNFFYFSSLKRVDACILMLQCLEPYFDRMNNTKYFD